MKNSYKRFNFTLSSYRIFWHLLPIVKNMFRTFSTTLLVSAKIYLFAWENHFSFPMTSSQSFGYNFSISVSNTFNHCTSFGISLHTISMNLTYLQFFNCHKQVISETINIRNNSGNSKLTWKGLCRLTPRKYIWCHLPGKEIGMECYRFV